MKPFNGVATKYLANYLHWFKWLQHATNEKDTIKAKHFFTDSAAELTDTRLEQYKYSEPIYI